MISKQDTFNTVVAHLRAQGKQADEGGYCKYRAPGGLKCAVGCLIPEAEYLPEFDEGMRPLTSVIEACPSLQAHDRELLRCLQKLHDVHPPKEWEAVLSALAKQEGLEYTAP